MPSETASDPLDQIRQLRRDLEPVAVQLCRLADALASGALGDGKKDTSDAPAVPPQLRRDLDKLQAAALAFQRGVAEWFGDATFQKVADASTAMRHSRHEARNRLNHLFGLIQLIEIGGCPGDRKDTCQEILKTLESCLALVSTDGKKDPAAASAEASPLPFAFPPGESRGRLLIADDDPENREILERLLSPGGFDLDFAVNGREAIDAIESHLYDAVLLDIEMPVMDGFEVLASMRESGHLRHTPVIVVTGLQEEQDAVRCIEIGAEDFLSRPIRPALLMARLNASLEKKRLRERVFEQHFTPELARELARNPDPMKMQARQAEVSVLFCDIRGFSSISERLGPTQTIDWLSGVMGEFSTIVIEHGGVLVDYTGDELMAMWGAPNEQPDHAVLACRAALDILGSLKELNEKWRPAIGAETQVGIGVNTGESLVGNVGTHRKFKYGPLGTCVNLASRVQGATRFLKSPLLITGNTAAQLPDGFQTRRLCRVLVQNISKPISLFELAPLASDETWKKLRDQYESALMEFESENFRRASSVLGNVLLSHPNDGPSLQLMSRVVEAMLNDGQDFSPVWSLPGK